MRWPQTLLPQGQTLKPQGQTLKPQEQTLKPRRQTLKPRLPQKGPNPPPQVQTRHTAPVIALQSHMAEPGKRRKPLSFWVPVVFVPVFLAFGVYECSTGQIATGIKDLVVGLVVLVAWAFSREDQEKPV